MVFVSNVKYFIGYIINSIYRSYSSEGMAERDWSSTGRQGAGTGFVLLEVPLRLLQLVLAS